MSSGVHPGRDSREFNEFELQLQYNSLYTSAKKQCRGNSSKTSVMAIAAEFGTDVTMIAAIIYQAYIFVLICVNFWSASDSTMIEILVDPLSTFFCCLIIALACFMSVKTDANETSSIFSVQVQVLTQVLKKFLILWDPFCIGSIVLLKQLRQILQEVEKYIDKDETLRVIFISEEGLFHLLTLYDMQRQYQLEKLLLANSKAFIQATYYVSCMFEKGNANAVSEIWSWESPKDVFTFLKFLWTIYQICAANINFIQASLEYEAASKLLTLNKSIQSGLTTVPSAISSHSAMDNENFRVIMSLGFALFRCLGGACLVYTFGLWALSMWILVDIFLSEILLGRACSTENNGLALDNPSPVQYSGFMKRIFTTGLSNYLLYNQGYIKHYRVPTIAILLLPGTISFYLSIMTFNGWLILSSPAETLEINVGACYFSAIFVAIIPVALFVVERLFIRWCLLNATTGAASIEV